MTPKTLSYQEALLNFSEICEEAYGRDPEPLYVVLEKTDGNKYAKDQTYVLVKVPRYLAVHFLKKALIRVVYNTYHMFKSFGNFMQALLPGIKRASSYSAQYVQTHLDDVLAECEITVVIVETEDEKTIGFLMPLELYTMMFSNDSRKVNFT